LGIAQRSLGQPNMAKASFARALELDPRMAQAEGDLAGLEVQDGNYKEALKLAGAALKANPDLQSAHLASAQAMLGKGDIKEGEAALQDTLGRDPVSLPALATLLSRSIRQGRTQEAVRRISELVRQYPQNPGLRMLLGVGYFNLKDLEKSEASVRQALALDPGTLDAHTLLANIDFARGSVEQAKSDLRAAIATNPRKPLNYMLLATQYEKENNWEEAKKLVEKAHEIDSASPIVAAELAFLYLEHGGDVNVAVSLAQMVKQKMPESAIAADVLGWSYCKVGSAEPAIAQLKEAVQKIPTNPLYNYHLGMAYMTAKRFDSARRSLQAALRDDPNFPGATSAKAALDKLSKE